MARYFQKRLNLVQPIPFSFAPIPGMSLTAPFDDGEVLLNTLIIVTNEPGGLATILGGWIRIDGEPVPTNHPRAPVGANITASQTFGLMRRLTAGVHTIDLVLADIGGAGILNAIPNSMLTIVQFPRWAPEQNIEEPA